MALVDGKPVCVIIPSDPRGLDETARFRIRRQVGADDEAGRCGTHVRLQGRPHQPVWPDPQYRDCDRGAGHDLVYTNGGQRGLQVRLSPRDAARLLHAIVAPLMA
jgi:Cys-tRNA(Pro)/Cys-tRNA(Cys) deacylase